MSTKSSRPTTPSLKLSAMAGRGGPPQPGPVGAAMMDPASPPQTPTSVSPLLNHSQPAAAIGHFPIYQNFARPSVRQGSNIRPVGTGHQFSYSRGPHVNRFAQLSPQSSSEDEEDDEEESQSESDSTPSQIPQSLDEDEDEDDEDEDASEDDTPSRTQPRPQRAPVVDSSSEEEEDEEDDESSSDEEGLQPPHRGQPTGAVGIVQDTAVASFVLEEMSDFDPMSDNRSDIMRPTGIESPNSQRARSLSHGAGSDSDNHSHYESPPPVQVHHVHLAHRPRHAVPHPDDPDLDHIPDLDRGMSNLNCTPEAEDDDDEVYEEDAETAAFAAAQREIRMRKRRSHGSSIGKRTHSERSDSDGEKDWTPLGDDVDVLGGSARRLRRRVGDRRSLLTFQDPPPERIEELEEPDSCAEDGWRNSIGVTRGSGSMFGEGDALRELPYWDLEIMEVDDE